MSEQPPDRGRMHEEATGPILSLPPAFRAIAAGATADVLSIARAMAAEGADPGRFVWAERDDRADCAVVLAPEAPLADSLLVAYVAMVAIGNSLGALLPPVVPVVFGWPDRIVLNGAPIGGIRLRAAATDGPDAVPAWMVVGCTLALKTPADGDEPGHAPDRTTLAQEGGGDLTATALLEGFARHFLNWINRWQEDGFAPVKAAWLARAAGHGPANQGMETTGPWADRTLLRMADDGSVTFNEGGAEVTRPLAEILAAPTWSL